MVLCSARLLGADAVLPWGLQEDEEGEEDADTPQAAGGAGEHGGLNVNHTFHCFPTIVKALTIYS